jgi:hypothetical protein
MHAGERRRAHAGERRRPHRAHNRGKRTCWTGKHGRASGSGPACGVCVAFVVARVQAGSRETAGRANKLIAARGAGAPTDSSVPVRLAHRHRAAGWPAAAVADKHPHTTGGGASSNKQAARPPDSNRAGAGEGQRHGVDGCLGWVFGGVGCVEGGYERVGGERAAAKRERASFV